MSTNNAFQVSSLVAKTMTSFFEQKSPLLNTSNRDYAEEFTQQSYATGGSINVKVPGYPAVQRGLSVTPSAIQDLIVPYTITVDDIYNVPRELNLFEFKFDILGEARALTAPMKKAIVDNYAYPAFQALEGALEAEAALRLKAATFITPIDRPSKLDGINTFSSISQVNMQMNLLKFPSAGRVIVMNNIDANAVSNSLQNMFNAAINQGITMNARVGGPDKGHLAGFDMYTSADFTKHVSGPLNGVTGITVTTVSADGTQITFTGVTSTSGNLVKAGDWFAIPSVSLVSNITYSLLPFTLVAVAAQDANGDGAGNVTITLQYPILASGEHQNVSALPSNGASVETYPDRNVNYAYVPAGLSTVPLRLQDIYGAANSDVRGENKVPVKVQLQGSVQAYTNIFRISMLVGIKVFGNYVIALPSKA